MKYIEAEKLKAEIERRKKKHQEASACGYIIDPNRLDEDEDILSLIDSLQQEQPEVDLEKEIEDYAYSLPHSSTGSSAYVSDKRLPIARQFGIEHEWSYEYVMEIAMHFWNKGYNTRKEE